MTSSATDDDTIAQLAVEIERYLAAHPHAADSADGVLNWWLRRQRYEESLSKIQRALELLVQRGAVSKRVLAGQVVYARGRYEPKQN